jgi:hypothetical protein
MCPAAKLSGGNYDFSGPIELAFHSRRLGVASSGNNSVTDMNAADSSCVRTAVGSDFGISDPHAPAFDGHYIWASDIAANSLTVLPPG